MKKSLIVLAFVASAGIYGCTKTEEPGLNGSQTLQTNPGAVIEVHDDREGCELFDETQVAVIGDKIPNPYALEVMREAYRNLTPATRALGKESDIVATHLYVVFKPGNYDELDVVQSDTTLTTFLRPLDHEISDGIIRADPRYSIDGFQHRWCVVPVDYEFPEGCPYEILEEEYMPDEWDLRGNNLTKAAAHLPTGLSMRW